MLLNEPARILLLLSGMMVVTYLPRLIPFLMIQDLRLAPRLKRFLELIPYAALGALIFPGVFTAVPGHPAAMTIGIGLAAVWAWFRGGIMVPVAGSIGIVYLMLVFFS
ncbi:MAG: AzlD domain-containing protein [Bacillota bacterium]|nr:AzlD domain-containing protein [Bacillota bacterium]MDW7677190.1 AzlD domain-containing protein [Bacillota bacterium]